MTNAAVSQTCLQSFRHPVVAAALKSKNIVRTTGQGSWCKTLTVCHVVAIALAEQVVCVG